MIGTPRTDADLPTEAMRRDRSLLIEALGERYVGGDVTRCPDPTHEDRNPSAGVYAGDDGAIRVKCQSCGWRGDVFDVRAVRSGRPLADVLREARANGSARPATTKPAGNGRKPRTVHRTRERAEQAAAWALAQRDGDGWAAAARYVYPGGGYVVVRFERDGEKSFAPIHTEGGGWALGDPAGKLPLYHGDDLGDGAVYVVEGEGVADAGRSIGLTTTTSSHGAKSASRTDWSPLAGRTVCVSPDADAPGERYAADVAAILHGLGCTVRVVRLPGLGDGGDLKDWLDGRDAIEPDALRAEIEALAEAAPLWTPAVGADDGEDDRGEDDRGEPARDFMLTDTGNAERLVATFGDRIRYVAAWGKWLIWSGVRWEADTTGQIDQLAKRTIRAIYADAAEQADGDRRKAMAAWAAASESATRRAAMVKLAQSEPGVAVAVEHMDRDNWLLNTITGTVCLRTGELRPHDPRDLITKLAPVDLAVGAAAPVYTGFMDRIFIGNVSLVEYVERLIGYFLTGDTRHHVLPIAWGDGANGKSTLFDLVLYILGDYAAPAPDSLMMQRTGDEHPTELADCFGRRLLIATENDEGRKLRIGTVKKLTGDAMLKGRYMRRDYFTFTRTHKLLLVTNNRPRVTEDSVAVWRRLRLIPFAVTIADAEQDRALPDKLRAEAGAILARWIAAGVRWQADGFDLAEPAVVTDATADYHDAEDVLADFIASDCLVAEYTRATRKELWEAYSRWADRERIPHPMGQRTLYERIRRLPGVREGEFMAGQRTQRGFEGIGLCLGGPNHA